jgi:hypothetical protein
LAIFFRSPTGWQPRPDLMLAAPQGAAIFDLGDALPAAGDEIVFMTSFGVMAQSLSGRRPAPPATIVRQRTLVSTPEEEDLIRWDFLRVLAPGQPPTMIVPSRGPVDFWRQDGSGAWKRWCKSRVPHQSFYDAESLTFKQGRRGGAGGRPFSLRMITVVPTITFADQTGDGIADLITTYEDRVAVHAARSDGTVSSTATYQRWLQFLSPQEQASRDTEMSLDVLDIDQDGIADLSATKIGGGITNLRSETRIYRGQSGGGFSPQPDQVFKDDNFAVIVRYVDLDGDGRLEMVHPEVEVSLFAMSQVFVSGKFGLDLRMRRRAAPGSGKVFEEKPVQVLETVFGLDFSTGGAMRGMAPLGGLDFDGDGKNDILLSQGADRMELHRGLGGKGDFFDDDPSLTLSGPISRETYLVPHKPGGKGELDVVAAFVDQPKMVGKILVHVRR